MIEQIIDLLNNHNYKNSKSDLILFAKGGYRYPRTFKEALKTAKLWLSRK